MPVMNGIELAIKIRAEMPDCAVLLFSGQASTGDMLQDAKERGYTFELLAKPVHPEVLLQKVRDIINAKSPN